MRICTKCNIDKSLDSFYKKVGNKYGVAAECKICSSIRRRNNFLKNKNKHLSKNKEYAEKNKEAIKCYQAGYREENKETAQQYGVEWRGINKEKIKEYQSNIYQENKNEIKKRVSLYQKNNRHINNAARAKYKAARLQATTIWRDDELISDMYLEARYFSCHIDHIVPLQSKLVCGLHWEGNLQLLSATDNCSKSNIHWPDMWEAA